VIAKIAKIQNWRARSWFSQSSRSGGNPLIHCHMAGSLPKITKKNFLLKYSRINKCLPLEGYKEDTRQANQQSSEKAKL
jgi:hypothetical protein